MHPPRKPGIVLYLLFWLNTTGSWAVGVAQGIEHLPSKHEALSSSHSTAKTKTKTKKPPQPPKTKTLQVPYSFQPLYICDSHLPQTQHV
jgi:hypothetical protein